MGWGGGWGLIPPAMFPVLVAVWYLPQIPGHVDPRLTAEKLKPVGDKKCEFLKLSRKVLISKHLSVEHESLLAGQLEQLSQFHKGQVFNGVYLRSPKALVDICTCLGDGSPLVAVRRASTCPGITCGKYFKYALLGQQESWALELEELSSCKALLCQLPLCAGLPSRTQIPLGPIRLPFPGPFFPGMPSCRLKTAGDRFARVNQPPGFPV